MAEPQPVYRRDKSYPDGKRLNYYRIYIQNPWTKKREPVINPANGRNQFATQAEARTHRDRAHAEMMADYRAKGHERPVHGNTKLIRTFREWAERWLASQGGTVNTRATREGHIMFALRHWDAADKPVEALTREDVNRLHQYMLDVREMSGHSISNYLGDLVRCIRDAQAAGLRRDNPVHDYWGKGYAHRQVRHVTNHEVESLIVAAGRHRRLGSYRWLAPAFLVSYDCGLRAGEIAGLTWNNVHLAAEVPYLDVCQKAERQTGRGILLVPYTKGKNSGAVPMSERVATALRELRDWQAETRTLGVRNPQGCVFSHSMSGGPISPLLPPRVLAKLWHETADEFGFEGKAPVWHDLRHSAAHNLAVADAPATVIRQMLRHGSLSTSQGYIDELSPSQLAAWQTKAQEGRHLSAVS